MLRIKWGKGEIKRREMTEEMESRKWWQGLYEPMNFWINILLQYLCRWICIWFINYFISLHFHHVWCFELCCVCGFFRRRLHGPVLYRCPISVLVHRFCVCFFRLCLTRSQFNLWSMRCARDACSFPRYTMPMLAYSLQMMNSRRWFFFALFLLIQLNCFNFSFSIFFCLSLFHSSSSSLSCACVSSTSKQCAVRPRF